MEEMVFCIWFDVWSSSAWRGRCGLERVGCDVNEAWYNTVLRVWLEAWRRADKAGGLEEQWHLDLGGWMVQTG